MTTKKKSIYLSILGVGLCVVAYDLISAEGDPARAVGAQKSVPEEVPGNAPGETDGLASLSVPHFPTDFGPSVSATVVRDIFVPTESTLNQLRKPKETAPAEGGDTQEVEAAPVPFAESHSLSAIMVLSGSRTAVVNGSVMHQGQSLSDCVLVEIGERSVRFECGAIIEELWLVDPLLGDRSD